MIHFYEKTLFEMMGGKEKKLPTAVVLTKTVVLVVSCCV